MRSLQHLWHLPKRILLALVRRFALVMDYCRYRKNFIPYLRYTGQYNAQKKKVLFVAGRGMNIGWAQMWTFLSLAFTQCNITPCVITLRSQWALKLYFKLVGTNIYNLEEELDARSRPFDTQQLTQLNTVGEWEKLHYHNMPVGQMVLSTYCRYHATGFIDPALPALKDFAQEWLQSLCRAYDAAARLYSREGITHVVMSETFIEEYGGFYYAALNAKLDVFKTSGTVRDNAIVVQRRSSTNARLHHASLTQPAWQKVLALKDYASIEQAVKQNFSDRYSDKWFRSQRNQKGTKIVSREEGRKELGLTEDRKAVVVFSHILYDALFHYGDELYQDYATWLVETIRIAMTNPRVEWFIKLHPSNLWRGEFQTLLGGKYEEEKIIQQHIGTLPPHVRLVYADTKISPYGWYQIVDYGISVRGTAGLEMAVLGKPVITAGTGRYEGNGFTVDPRNIEEYQRILLSLPELPALTAEQVELATRYAHGLFNMKPFTLSSLQPLAAFGKRHVKASDDICYIPKALQKGDPLPPDLQRFITFIHDTSEQDLLT